MPSALCPSTFAWRWPHWWAIAQTLLDHSWQRRWTERAWCGLLQGVTTKDSAAGPPDVYPNAFDSVNAWTPYIDNDGIQTMELTIRT